MQNTTGPFLTSKKDIVEQVRRRIERGDKPINLPVKLLLGEASERSTKDFEQRPPEERTREAYRSDFHEVDAYATQPFGEEDDGVFRMGEGSQDTDFSDRSSGRATRVRFDLSSLAYREPEELDGAESSPPQDFSDRDSLHTEDGDEYEGGVSS